MANKEYELAIKIAGMVDKTLGDSCSLTKKQLREISKEAANANKNGVSFQTAMGKAGPGIDAAWNGAKKTVLTTVEAMAAAGAAITAIGVASVGVGKEFESAMSSWGATASASQADYIKAKDAAMEMGRTTSKTATESAQALEYMALAGWSVEDSISGLPGVLRLSEATGLDLARTSDLVTDSMSALGVTVEGLDEYLDVAAKANNKSNQTAEQLMEAYLGVGGTMKNLRIPIQESATALGVLANRGIKGSEAGNALNAVMVNLTTGTGQAGKMMDKLGISAFDSKGNFIGLYETFDLLNNAMKNLNEEEKNAALAAIGGKLHVDALNAVMSGMNTIVEDGVTEWDKLESELYDASGALEQMANTKLDNLQGDVAILQSALQDSGIRIYDSIQEPLREGTQYVTKMIYDFSENIVDELESTIPTIKRHFGEAKEAMMGFVDPLIKVGQWMIDNPDVIVGGLAAIGTTIVSLKLAKTITDTASAMDALRIAMMSNPITAAIGVAALAGGAIVGLSAKVKIANNELKKQKLQESFGNITLSMEELEETAKFILGEDTLQGLSEAMEELGKVSDISDIINENSRSISKLSWKIGMGMVLDEEDQGQFDEAIESMVNNSIKLVEQAQYTAHLSVNTLFGEGDATGMELISGFDALYQGINEEVEQKGRELGEAYNKAMEDGIINTEEAKIIQELQEQLGRITKQVAQSQLDAKLERIKVEYSGKALDVETFQNLQAEVQNQITEAVTANRQSYEYNLAGLNLRLERSKSGEIDKDDAAYLAQDEHVKLKRELDNQLTENRMELELKGLNFQTQTVTDAFKDLEYITPELESSLSNALQKTIDQIKLSGNASVWSYDDVVKLLNLDSLDSATRDAISELWKSMEPQYQAALALKKQYEAANKEIPQYIAESINNAEAIGIVAGSQEALWEALGDSAKSSPAIKESLKDLEEIGAYMPEAISDSIMDNKSNIDAGVDGLYNYTNRYMKDRFKYFSVSSNVNIDFMVAGSQNSNPPALLGMTYAHASGGIFNTPHYGVFAEAGPEAFIPLDGTEHSKSIWQKAGETLGMYKSTTGSGSVISNVEDNSQSRPVYAPVYHIYGANEETVRNATGDDYAKFERFLSQYEKNKSRLAF